MSASTSASDSLTTADDLEAIIERAEAPTRTLAGRAGSLIFVALVLMSLYHLYAVIATIPTHAFRASHLMFTLPLALVLYPAARGRRATVPWYDVILAVLAIAATAYVLVDFDRFVERSVTPSLADVTMGAVLMLLILEATRRTVSPVLTGLVVAFLLYAWLGSILPGAWGHRGYDLERTIGHLYMTLEGIFGVPLDVAATYIILFTIYGSVLEASKAGRFFVELAFAATGRQSAGAGRGAVLASLLLGAVTGSGVATTVTVGTVTWPMLERAGYPRDAAAGILAAGGIGAVISPPVMGAAAFLIAEFVQVSYLKVIRYALIPTFLYYLGILLMLELDARRFALKPVTSPMPRPLTLLGRYWYHFVSLFLLVGLMVAGLTPMFAATWAVVLACLTSLVRRESALLDRRFGLVFLAVAVVTLTFGSQLGLGSVVGIRSLTAAAVFGLIALSAASLLQSRLAGSSSLNAALATGSRQILAVSVTTAAAGLIIGVVSLTGLGLKFGDLIIGLGVGNRFLTLIMAALSVWTLGLALPITASYIIAAVIVAPALVKLGVPIYAAHMFIFYYAVLSEVSPPVGLSPLAASAITGANFYRAMMAAWRYTLPVFLVPFAFTSGPSGLALLMQGTVSEILVAVVTAAVGLAAVVFGAAGWFRHPIGWTARALFVASGGLLFYAGLTQDIVGIALFVVAVVLALRAPRS
ncbi:MAG: TRAP transporter fused permease subunit [Acidobacteria bacterium]|nr:TRAP transporter fused permease subunit [Acidobacteriota bacterium]